MKSIYTQFRNRVLIVCGIKEKTLALTDFWFPLLPVLLLREGNTPGHHLSITYRQLLSQVCRCANVLKQMGEKRETTHTLGCEA